MLLRRQINPQILRRNRKKERRNNMRNAAPSIAHVQRKISRWMATWETPGILRQYSLWQYTSPVVTLHSRGTKPKRPLATFNSPCLRLIPFDPAPSPGDQRMQPPSGPLPPLLLVTLGTLHHIPKPRWPQSTASDSRQKRSRTRCEHFDTYNRRVVAKKEMMSPDALRWSESWNGRGG